jgi:hypothetical protein
MQQEQDDDVLVDLEEQEDDGTYTIREARTNAPVDAVATKEADAGAFAAIFEASTKRGAGALNGGSAALKRREISFLLDGGVGMLRADGAPVFSDEEGNVLDIRINMRSLTSTEEKNVIKSAMQNPSSLPFELAKASLFKVAGEKVDAAKKEWFWEVIGSGGRQICVVAYTMIGGASQSVLGKYRTSMSLG